jgi:hypothetical protein
MNDCALSGAKDTRKALSSLSERLVDRDYVAGTGSLTFPLYAEIAEVALLLSGGQAAALERAAHRQRVTVGQLLRCLIQNHLANEESGQTKEDKNIKPNGLKKRHEISVIYEKHGDWLSTREERCDNE